MTARKPIDRERLTALFDNVIPFNRFLGVHVTEVGDGVARLELPFRTEFVGNPLLKTLHGGVISMLLDNCGGAAVWTQIGRNDLVSTVDLRVDYLRPGPLADLACEAEVVRMGNRVAVTDMKLFAIETPERVIATGTGVYNIKRTED